MSDPFYKTRTWHRMRKKCLIRDDYKCKHCQADVYGKGKARVDHIVPRSQAPELELELANLRTLCVTCDNRRHREKGRAGLKARGINITKPEQVETGPDGMPVDPENAFNKR